MFRSWSHPVSIGTSPVISAGSRRVEARFPPLVPEPQLAPGPSLLPLWAGRSQWICGENDDVRVTIVPARPARPSQTPDDSFGPDSTPS